VAGAGARIANCRCERPVTRRWKLGGGSSVAARQELEVPIVGAASSSIGSSPRPSLHPAWMMKRSLACRSVGRALSRRARDRKRVADVFERRWCDGPRVLFVYFTYTQRSLRVAEGMADVLRIRGCDVRLAGIELTDSRYAERFTRFPLRHAIFDILGMMPAQLRGATGEIRIPHEHLGGTRDPMVVHWPKRIREKGRLRSQFTHITDVGPTILEAAGVPKPAAIDGVEQKPMHGTSFMYSLDDASAAERHTQQYFEILGNRAMYKDGWWLSMMMPRIPCKADPETLKRFAPGVWDPDGMVPPMPEQSQFTFYGDVQNVGSGTIPRIFNHSYTISAELEIPDGGAEGVIVAEADHLGGFSLFVDAGKLHYTYSFVGVVEFKQESETQLPNGSVNVRTEFAADAPQPATGGEVTLYVNGNAVGGGRMEHTVPVRYTGYAGMDIGRDDGMPVDRSYADRSPFAFTGTIKKVVFDINPHLNKDDEREVHEHAHQALAGHAINA
jgi:hypothetical protein